MIDSVLEGTYRTYWQLPEGLRRITDPLFSRVAASYAQTRKTPTRVTFFATNKCNQKCAHCFYWSKLGDGAELKLSEVQKLASSFKHRLHALILSGGEPVLRSDLVEVCKAFDLACGVRKLVFTSNGFDTSLLRETVEGLLGETRAKLEVQVSLDGLQETHDSVRGCVGAFNNAVESVNTLKMFKEQGGRLTVSVNTTISNKNVDGVEELMHYVKDNLGVFHKFGLVRGSRLSVKGAGGHALSGLDPKNPSLLQPPKEKIERVFKKIIYGLSQSGGLQAKVQAKKLESTLIALNAKRRSFKCFAGVNECVIYPSGEVAFCEMTKPFANVRDFDLDFHGLWHSKKASEGRSKIKDCFCTHSCNLITSALALQSPCESP